jgi:hypothetical protein
MSIKVLDRTQILQNYFERKTNLFLRFALEEIERYADPITPRKTGDLSKRKLKIVTGNRGIIQWRTRYAAAQEVGRFTVRQSRIVKIDGVGFRTLKPGIYRFRNYTTANTGSGFAYLGVSRAFKDGGKRVMKRAGLVT